MPLGFFKKKPVPPEVQQAYDSEYLKARIERARKLGREAGLKGPQSKTARYLDGLTRMGDNVLKSGFFGNEPPKSTRRKRK